MPRNKPSPKKKDFPNTDCIDVGQNRNFEVVKSIKSVTHVLRSLSSNKPFVTIRNNRVKLVTDSRKNDVLDVYTKVNRKEGAIVDYYVVCFTKKIGKKTFCLVPQLNTCYEEFPSTMELTLQELPADWKHDHDEIPENEYIFWFQHKKINSCYSIFTSFYSSKYVMKVNEDTSLILNNMAITDAEQIPVSVQFEFMPIPKQSLLNSVAKRLACCGTVEDD